MVRRPRLYGENLYHHIYAWGNNKHVVFITEQHYKRYLSFLEAYSIEFRLDIVAYALMRTHVHLFVHDRLGRISQFMNKLHGEYAQYFNHVTGGVGHVFGQRFNNRIVQAKEYGLWLSRYIHRQAVEAGIVTDPKEYPWTSYHAYLGRAQLTLLKPDVVLEQFGTNSERIRRYEEFVMSRKPDPTDWDSKSLVIVGDEKFRQEVGETGVNCGNEMSEAEILCTVAERFKVDPMLICGARGLGAKRTRRMIVVYLVKEVGISPAKVARLCQISRSAVQKMLQAKVQKCMPGPGV